MNLKLFTLLIALLYGQVSFSETITLLKERYRVFYDEEQVGMSEQSIHRANFLNEEGQENEAMEKGEPRIQTTWLVESTQLYFESFFGDLNVDSLSQEIYDYKETLERAFYLSLYNDYLTSVVMKPINDSRYKVTTNTYELSATQEQAIRQNWTLYKAQLQNQTEIEQILNTTLRTLQIDESVTSLIEKKKFDYTLSALILKLSDLIREKSDQTITSKEYRLLTLDDADTPVKLAKVEIRSPINKTKLELLINLSEDHQTYYEFTKSSDGLSLERVVDESDDGRFEFQRIR